MDSFLASALLILVLVLLTALLAMAETALISVRRGRIRELAEAGDDRARAVMKLHDQPERLFATVQVGVTVLQVLAAGGAGVLALAHLPPMLGPLLERAGLARLSADVAQVSVLLALILFAYVVLTFGQLIPKSIGYRFAEPLALFVVGPISTTARLARPLVSLLTASTRLFIRPFGGRGSKGAFVSPEEINFLLREGKERGIFEPPEHELIHGVYEFSEKLVREVMVPRPKIHALRADTPPEEILSFVVQSGYSRYPVYTRSIDDTHGILYNKDLLECLARKRPLVIKDLLHPVHFVPENKKVSQLLKEMQRRRLGMSMVVNEYGNVEGLVTMEDLLEEIVGEIQDEYDHEERPVERLPGGGLLVDGSLNLGDLKDAYGLPFPESPEYETLAGFLLSRLERIPRGGEVVQEGAHRLTVVDMDGKRIHRVKIEPLAADGEKSRTASQAEPEARART
jgi:putative hemolysin